MQTNGHRATNGHEQTPANAIVLPNPGFTEDESGTTIDSGAAVCRFNPGRGGRIERWQWRTLPPLDARQPGVSQRPDIPLDLVDPAHGALIDHFLPLGSKPEEVVAGTYREFGDFAEEPYRSQTVDSGGEIRI